MVSGVLWSPQTESLYMRGQAHPFHYGVPGTDGTSNDKRGNWVLTHPTLNKQGLQLTPKYMGERNAQHGRSDRAVVVATAAATQLHGSIAIPGVPSKTAPHSFCNGLAEQDCDDGLKKTNRR